MMYLHFCKQCNRIYMLNGHKQLCPKCRLSLTELQMSYLDYTSLTSQERLLFLEQCQNEDTLKELSTIYRMYKYSKWYTSSLADAVSESV